MSDYLKEIESIKKRLSELESKIKEKDSSINAFGRSYSKVGSSNSDFLILTKGLVKVQWGKKFIDLIKDGKINVDAKFIYKDKLVGTKDGIYIIEDEDELQVILQIKGQLINLKGDIGTTYVSFLGKQTTDSDQKYIALTNIGFLYKDINSVDQTSLKNGIIYIESEKKLYIVLDGSLSEFILDIPNPYNKLLVIQKSDTSMGSILILGNGIENSLAFDLFYLYTKEGKIFFESNGDIYFKVKGLEKVKIKNDSIIFSDGIITPMILSEGATNKIGYRLYYDDGESTLEIDNLIVRNLKDIVNLHSYLPVWWYYRSNVVLSMDEEDEEDEEQSRKLFQVTLGFKNEFELGQILYSYVFLVDEETGFYNQILLPLKVESINTEDSDNIIYVSLMEDFMDSAEIRLLTSDLFNAIKGLTIFLISREGESTFLLRRSQNNLDLIEIDSLEQANGTDGIVSRFGNLDELGLLSRENNIDVPIKGYGIYSNNGIFLKALYNNNYTLPENDNSTKFASTEWINKLVPKGTIVMYSGLISEIPEGWGICDGTNGTPNLIGKFIKAEKTSGTEDEIIILTSTDPSFGTLPEGENLENQSIKYYSLIFIVKLF